MTGLEKLLYRPENPFPSAVKLVRESGSSEAEQTVIQAIRLGQKEFSLGASNQILSFGARIGYYVHTDEHFKSIYNECPITVTFHGLACGQSFGFAAPSNLILITENANDGTGTLLDGAKIYIKNLAGNTTGFGATSGHIYMKKTGGRAGTRNSGAHIITEKLGSDGAGFMTGGTFTVLADANYYPELSLVTDDKERSFLTQDVIGPNFGSGFTGGLVFLPVALYQKMQRENFLAQSALEIQPQELSDAELIDFVERLASYRKIIVSTIVDALLRLEKSALKHCFIKLDPAVKKFHESEVGHLDSYTEDFVPVTDAFELTVSDKRVLTTGLHNLAEVERDACGTGVLVNRDGKATRNLVMNTITMLQRFMHRGATGVDPDTGDGCGITWYGLDRFFQQKFPHLELKNGNYAVIHVAFPTAESERTQSLHLLRSQLGREDLRISGERDVPINNSVLGSIGQRLEPIMKQFIVKKHDTLTQQQFDNKLIRAHLRFEFLIQQDRSHYKIRPHIISAACNNVIYKGMVKENKMGEYFLDFKDPSFLAHAAVAHSRFATNTFPTFMNIQLFRNLGNNGENNALQQIINALTFDPLLKNILGLECINFTGFSDSHIMSIYMDMLRLLGYSAEEIVAFTIHPYAPLQDASSQYYNLFGTPFEGPNASIVTIGNKILVVRDRNGFRPQRGVINDQQFYCGSELGAVDIHGETFNLEPAKPLVIDFEAKSIYVYQETSKNFHKKQLQILKKCILTDYSEEPLFFHPDELFLRKMRAGWSEELDQKLIQPLFNRGKDNIVSMGDHRPTEALVNKAHLDFGAFFKGKFSQVTNPPLDSKREKEYMSACTFVGRKPELWQVGKNWAQGFLLTTPIVNNHEMTLLMQSEVLCTETLNIIFPIKDFEEGLMQAIDQICAAAIDSAKNGTTFLVLSDLLMDDEYAAIPPVIITSFVHEALLKDGLRRQVTVGLRSASTLTVRDVAEVISIGGVDVVNPYLPFIPESGQNLEEFRKKCRRYQDGLCDELLSFMARVGISTVSAYRGTKAFNAYGLDEDLAKSLGICSELGGVGLREIARMVLTQHQQPKCEGLGRLNSDSDWRDKIWDVYNTRGFIDRARGKRDNTIETRIDLLKRSTPRGQFFLSPPPIWTEENPMPICILGGGAAGFYQAQVLLEMSLPISILIVEKNAVNRLGLIGSGVAPDHLGTKNQAKILREVLDDARVNYYGGVEVGKDISLDDLKSTYPCIIDCRGAALDVKLGLSGESHERVVPASVVYKAYNNAFNLTESHEDQWSFFYPSKNSEIGIIGNGNVAADIARIFLKEVDAFKKTSISPRFLSLLESNAPDCVRIFARGAPHKTKISFHELEQLQSLKNVWLSATFDESSINVAEFDSDESELYEFFQKIKGQGPLPTYTKRLYFHFNCMPQCFIEKGSEIEAVFLGPHQEEYRYRAKTFITSLGSQVNAEDEFNEPQMYASGWVIGKGGKLSFAEKSAEETADKIKNNFLKGFFHSMKPPAKEQLWQLKSPVGNREQKNILDYCADGFHIETIADFCRARQYSKSAVIAVTPHQEEQSSSISLVNPPDPQENKVIVFDPTTNASQYYDACGDETFLSVLQKNNNAPDYQCDGDQQCGECLLAAIHIPVEAGKKEAKLIRANGRDPAKTILSCARKMCDLSGGVFISPKKTAPVLD